MSSPQSPLSTARDDRAAFVRSGLRGLLVAGLLAGLAGCHDPVSVTLEFTQPTDLNPRIRLDRQPLSGEQMSAPEYSGPYRDGFDERILECAVGTGQNGGCEVIAPVTPRNVAAAQLENLLQSDCLFVGAGADNVAVSWELIAHVRRQPMHLSCESPTSFGFCRLAEPGTARALAFQDLHKDFVGCSQPEPAVSETMDVAFGSITGLPLTFASKGGPVVVDSDLHLAATPLRTEYVGRGTPDPNRGCPGSVVAPVAIDGGAVSQALLYGDGCGAIANANSDGCARDCLGTPPAGDNALRLRDTSSNVSRWLRPNLMVIGSGQTIARTMSAVAGDPALRRWQIEVSSSGNPNTARWHENFSPNLQVTSIRVFVPGVDPARTDDDTVPTADLIPPPLSLSGTYFVSLENADPFTIECTGTTMTNGWVYLLTEQNCSGNQHEHVHLGVTPAYMHQQLNLAVLPLDVPLAWQVRMPGPASPVMIEFQMAPVRDGAALLASPAVIDLGGIVIGRKGDRFVDFENVGDVPLVVTSATLGGTDAGDFGYRLLAARRPMPLPISIATTPHKRVVEQIEGYAAMPLDIAATATVGPTHTHLVRSMRDGVMLNVFNNQLVYDGSAAIYVDAPRAVPFRFAPGSAALVTLDAYPEAHLPLTLDPGRSLRVLIKAQPRSYGLRRAQLKLEAYAAIGAHTVSAAAVLQVDGKVGGLPRLHPGYAPIADVGRAGGNRHLLLENSGDRDVVRGRITLANGRNFRLVAGNATQQVLAPGTSEVITVRFTPTCPGSSPPTPVVDRIRVDTNWGRQETELVGFADCSH